MTESQSLERTVSWRIAAALLAVCLLALGVGYTVEFLPKMKIEIVVADGVAADKVVALITAAAKTGSIGDGKVFVEPLEEAVRIRTGERGNNAV